MRVAIEFAGIYAERIAGKGPAFSSWDWKILPTHRPLLTRLAEQAFIILHTVLVSEETNLDLDAQRRALESWLALVGLPWDIVWSHPGKPLAEHYIEEPADLQALCQQLDK